MSGSHIDHVLIIGFGAPARPDEVGPYLEGFARGREVSPDRIEKVARQYEAIGGFSPYNARVLEFSGRLSLELAARGIKLPVFVGMRNWSPRLEQTLAGVRQGGFKKGLGVVLAPHRSEASFDRYLESVARAKTSAGAVQVDYEYLAPWHENPLFIEAAAGRFLKSVSFAGENGGDPAVVFSAHSIPRAMALNSRYAEEVVQSSARVARRAGISRWSVAYHSEYGGGEWLGPDVASVLARLAAEGERRVVFVPIGFLCDNAEILFDLDIAAKNRARDLGIEYRRAATVLDHPAVVRMFAELIGSECSKA